MDRFWLKSYPPSVPPEIDPGEYRSLKHLIESGCERFGDRKAFVCVSRLKNRVIGTCLLKKRRKSVPQHRMIVNN